MVLDVLVALLSNGAVNQNACILREIVCDVGNLAALGDLVVVSNVDLGTLLQVISCEGDGLLCSINSEGLALNRGVSNNSVLSTLRAIACNQPEPESCYPQMPLQCRYQPEQPADQLRGMRCSK